MRIIFGLAALAAVASAQDGVVKLQVDASEAPRRLFHVRMNMPAKPGPLTLLYPKWIPGEHGPTGPITDLVGIKIEAKGQPLAWKRDDVNMFAFHVTVPPGASALDVTFDLISPPESPGFSSGGSVTSELAVLNWNQVLLYPEGASPETLNYQATLRVPHSWRYGTALPIAREAGDQIEFQPTPFGTVIDSPLSMGAHYRTIDLGADGKISHYLHLAADSDRALEIPAEDIGHYRSLVKETGALFGSRHYRDYHFLLTLSDHVASFGLEHHESSDDRIGERGLIDEEKRKANADLLPHEFTHSWNGKFRRPAGLVTPDYSQPMKGELLWVYEGLTQYLGEVLAARSGLYTPEEFRENLARTTAALDKKIGRTWRPLEDTAVAAQLLYFARSDYAGYRRGVDYYDEGTLIWLDADVTIRELSKGEKSLNDFCRTFHGGAGGAPTLKPYSFDDVVAGLNSVQPYDWAKFLRDRLETTAAHAPLGGIENGGWKLVFDANRSSIWIDFEQDEKATDLSYSLGLMVREDGAIDDVAVGSAAYKAGIPPAVKLIAVDERQFNPTLLRETVQKTTSGKKTIDLLIKNGEYYQTHRVEYQGGEKYPHLVRDESKPDVLSEILKPLAK